MDLWYDLPRSLFVARREGQRKVAPCPSSCLKNDWRSQMLGPHMHDALPQAMAPDILPLVVRKLIFVVVVDHTKVLNISADVQFLENVSVISRGISAFACAKLWFPTLAYENSKS